MGFLNFGEGGCGFHVFIIIIRYMSKKRKRSLPCQDTQTQTETETLLIQQWTSPGCAIQKLGSVLEQSLHMMCKNLIALVTYYCVFPLEGILLADIDCSFRRNVNYIFVTATHLALHRNIQILDNDSLWTVWIRDKEPQFQKQIHRTCFKSHASNICVYHPEERQFYGLHRRINSQQSFNLQILSTLHVVPPDPSGPSVYARSLQWFKGFWYVLCEDSSLKAFTPEFKLARFWTVHFGIGSHLKTLDIIADFVVVGDAQNEMMYVFTLQGTECASLQLPFAPNVPRRVIMTMSYSLAVILNRIVHK